MASIATLRLRRVIVPLLTESRLYRRVPRSGCRARVHLLRPFPQFRRKFPERLLHGHCHRSRTSEIVAASFVSPLDHVRAGTDYPRGDESCGTTR
ncbi:MAG: hypothetical protein JWQ87_3488 [Candidatus Sulfotelmatobacter sp.]|nr:hypothetical protein [Candidatus Sulfotelmatobacter sp.]